MKGNIVLLIFVVLANAQVGYMTYLAWFNYEKLIKIRTRLRGFESSWANTGWGRIYIKLGLPIGWVLLNLGLFEVFKVI